MNLVRICMHYKACRTKRKRLFSKACISACIQEKQNFTGQLLGRVGANLLSNALKYAMPGTRVYLSCQATEAEVAVTFRTQFCARKFCCNKSVYGNGYLKSGVASTSMSSNSIFSPPMAQMKV